MGLFPAAVQVTPDFVSVYGHSYWQFNFGTRTQAGRADGLFRASLDIEFTNFVGHAVNGSRLTVEGCTQGGIGRLMQNVSGSTQNHPYVSQGGSFFLGWGINDLGFNTDTAQYRTAYQLSLRAAISRCRMSTLRDNDWAGTNGTIAFGASWSLLSGTQAYSSGSSVQWCSTAANDASHTFTITLPTDYTGTAVSLGFIANPGVTGGTITWGGTAGIAGSDYIGNIMPSASLNHSYWVKRITTLTSANAGQTITGTVASIDTSGNVFFDCFWVESETPNLVLVTNIGKLTTTGYAVYVTPPTDGQVDTWNAVIDGVIAEFDSMVQKVDVDASIDKTNFGTGNSATLAGDGLHPTEFGAARLADTSLKAVQRARPSSLGAKFGSTAFVNSQSARMGSINQLYRDGQWYTTETSNPTNTNVGTANQYPFVAGDMFAIPFYVSQGQGQVQQWSITKTVGSTTTAPTVFLALCDDRQYRCYPQYMHAQPANSTALPLVTGAGTFTSNTVSGNNGYILQPLDPGLYWWVLKIITIGTGTSATNVQTLQGQSRWMPNLTTAGAGGVAYNGYKWTGQGSTAIPDMIPAGGVLTANCPYIGLKFMWLGQP